MNSQQRTVQLPTKEIILLIFFQKFRMMQLCEALHHLIKARHGTIRLRLTALGAPFVLQIFSTPDASRKKNNRY